MFVYRTRTSTAGTMTVPVIVCCLLLMLLCFSHNTDTLCMMCVRDASLVPHSNACCASSHAVLTKRRRRRQPCVTHQHQLGLGGVPYPARQRPALSCTNMARGSRTAVCASVFCRPREGLQHGWASDHRVPEQPLRGLRGDGAVPKRKPRPHSY